MMLIRWSLSRASRRSSLLQPACRSCRFQLPLKGILRKPANFLPEANQLIISSSVILRSPSGNFPRTSSSDWKLIAIVAPGGTTGDQILLRCFRFVLLIRFVAQLAKNPKLNAQMSKQANISAVSTRTFKSKRPSG
jgi:hypothetical protein